MRDVAVIYSVNMSVRDTSSDRPNLGRVFSREMYENVLLEKGPNKELNISYATFLVESGQVTESLEVLFHTYKLFTVSPDHIYPVISIMVDYMRQHWRENISPVQRNLFSCPSCKGVLHEPITISCGHTYCRMCLHKGPLRTCKVCQCRVKNQTVNVKPNVLISSLVDRWWAGEVECVKLRSQGNECFRNKQLEKAVDLYNQAFRNASQDHLLLSNRSHVLHTMGKAEEALKDAEAAVRCRPEWAKGYFRKAMALDSLGHYEDSLICLMQCAVLEESNSLHSIKDEICKAYHRLLTRLTSGRRYSLDRYHHHHLHHHHLHHLHHCYSRHTPALSDPSIPPASDSEDSEDSDDGRKTHPSGNSPLLNEEIPHLRIIMEKYNKEMERNKKVNHGYVRAVDPNSLDKKDFECTLCFRYLYQPVTTPCGHSFCRTCLDRCLDHSTFCPLCKTSLKLYLAERRSAVTEFVEKVMQTLMAGDCKDRQRQHEEEMDELAAAGKDSHHEIPIFIATLAIPTVSCPLHVFEPRYRLMIRRCMESGTREFGMCMPMDNAENGYADYGTMLEIRDVEYTADGRSIVNTIGSRRFKIVSKGARDGYNTAAVEYLQDERIANCNLGEVRCLHDRVHMVASQWFDSIEGMTKRRILSHYGSMPTVEREYWTSPNGPAWMWWIIAILPLDHQIQLTILRETSLQRRLEVTHKILHCVMVQQRTRQVTAAVTQ